MHDGSIVFLCRNDLAETESLQEKVYQFCALHGVPRRHEQAFNLAVDELLTNVIRHGFASGSRHDIKLRIELEDRQLTATIEDDGREFNPLDYPPINDALPVEDRPLGGLGIHLVRSLVTGMNYERRDQKNVLTIRRRVG